MCTGVRNVHTQIRFNTSRKQVYDGTEVRESDIAVRESPLIFTCENDPRALECEYKRENNHSLVVVIAI